ncbi:hypothetical protein DH2020_008617 [Rehmannia glutinosa]|uniref:Receptor-like serine/threonine-protein kinase n=1 Tax=Rehmannia glutinosa TaxID=99300 RepID=A0ABR0X781_REHGL
MAHFQFTIILCSLVLSITFPKFSVGVDTLFANQTLVVGQTLISQSQTFELGFFSPGKSKNKFLGIWYKSTPGVCVWVANRNDPIIDSQGVFLAVAGNGTLVISGGGSIIWSANSSGVASNPILQLLDTGNLVLLEDSSQSYIWQSFDYPTDTWLPGMKMVDDIDAGLEKYLTSWKNPDDPSPGDYVFKIENQGLPEMVIFRGTTKRFRTGKWNGLFLCGVPRFPNPVFKPELVFEKDRLISIYELYDSSFIVRLTLGTSGVLERYTMNGKRDKWNSVYTNPHDPCDEYGQCGNNGICRIDKPVRCECFKGFAPKFQKEWDFQDWSGGCSRIRPLNCQTGDGFLEVKQVKHPDMLRFWLNTSMMLEECRDECLRNCSCTAYANPYITNVDRGCLMWFGDLIDTRELSGADSKQNIYIRLPASELDSSTDLQKEKEKKRPIMLILISIASGILVSGFINGAQEMNKRDVELPVFKLVTIMAATNNFSRENIVGEGGFGPVYKGNLSAEEEIAVKRLSRTSGQGLEEFKNEVILIAKLQHRNLVRLLGCCIEGEERMLIYEYLQNKSLDHFVFEYTIDGKFSVKSDIFSLGVVLLEIVSGKKNRAFDHCDHYYGLLGHAWLLWKENKILELMDECFKDTFVESQVKRCIQVGLLCVQKFAEDRPDMSSVIFMLGTDGAILPEPKEPGFFIERSSSPVRDCTSPSKMSYKETMTITDLEAR